MSMRRRSLRLVPRRSTPDPRHCARLLGEYVRDARLCDGRPLEELAPLAGLTVSQWESIEAGQSPCTWEAILAIAMVLRRGRSWMQYLAPLWARANPPLALGQ